MTFESSPEVAFTAWVADKEVMRRRLESAEELVLQGGRAAMSAAIRGFVVNPLTNVSLRAGEKKAALQQKSLTDD